MSFWLLIRRSLAYHVRSHLGVIVGAAIGTAALTGALLVGDSVRGSLRDHALERLQGVSYALSSGDRFFREDLAERLGLTSVSLTNVKLESDPTLFRVPSDYRATEGEIHPVWGAD